MKQLVGIVVRGAWAVRRRAADAALAVAFFGGLACLVAAGWWVYPPAGLVVLGLLAIALVILIVAGTVPARKTPE